MKKFSINHDDTLTETSSITHSSSHDDLRIDVASEHEANVSARPLCHSSNISFKAPAICYAMGLTLAILNNSSKTHLDGLFIPSVFLNVLGGLLLIAKVVLKNQEDARETSFLFRP